MGAAGGMTPLNGVPVTEIYSNFQVAVEINICSWQFKYLTSSIIIMDVIAFLGAKFPPFY